MDNAQPQAATQSDTSWRRLEDLVEAVTRLATTDIAPSDFHARVLAAILDASAAEGGAVWTPAMHGRWRCQHVAGSGRTELRAGDVAASERHDVLHGLATGAGNVLWPGGLLSAIRCDHEITAILEIWTPDSDDLATRHGRQRLLDIVAEAAAEFHLRLRLQSLTEQKRRWVACDKFVIAAHESLSLDQCAGAIVNEARQLLNVDRASLLVVRRGRARMRAISNVDAFDRRSDAVRRLEMLVDVVLAGGEPLRYPDGAVDLAPQLEAAVDAYQDASHARRIVVLPLTSPDGKGQRALAAIVFEQFSSAAPPESSAELESYVAGHAASAVANSLQHERIPGFRLWTALEKTTWFLAAKRLPRTAAAAIAATLAIAALAVIPTELTIEARGQAQPAVRRTIFAPRAGIVDDVVVGHSASVSSGDALLRLRSPELDYELARVSGELATVRQRLSALSAARLGEASPASARRETPQQLAAQVEELRQSQAALERQEAILREQEAELLVRSPVDGKVLTTWDELAALAARPVARGDALMTVANVDGEWSLELDVPERDAGHVLSAARVDGSLEVEFALATQPGRTFRGTLDQLAPSASGEGDGDRRVEAHASVQLTDADDLRPGATVVAKIHCGSRSIGYVWLHRFWEELQRWAW